MKFDRKSAKALSNEKELALFDSSRAPKLNKHTAAQLKQLVAATARTLKDKLTDVKRSQVRTGQATTAQRGVVAADRSKEKAELYSDVHDRFVKRLAEVEASAATKATAAAAPAKPTKKINKVAAKADRTLVRQKLKSVKRDVNAPTPGPAGKAKVAPAAPKAAKKPLASAARSGVGKGKPVITRSSKATTASKAAVNPEVDALQSKQSAARKPTSQGKVTKTRIAKSTLLVRKPISLQPTNGIRPSAILGSRMSENLAALNIPILLGTNRRDRSSESVAKWVFSKMQEREDIEPAVF